MRPHTILSYEAQLYLELEWTRIQRDGTRITDTQQEWFGSVSVDAGGLDAHLNLVHRFH